MADRQRRTIDAIGLNRSRIQSQDSRFGSIDKQLGKLAEGAFTAAALAGLAAARGNEMPVAQAVAAIVAGEAGVEDVIAGLLARPLRGEMD